MSLDTASHWLVRADDHADYHADYHADDHAGDHAGERDKVRLPGTSRAASPADTLDMATLAAGRVGITRVADVTRLDSIGIPTYQAIRPLARTLAVSQGKGVTPLLARLSAILESVEIWHVEQSTTPVVTAPAREVADRLGYPVSALPRAEPSLLHDGLPLDWLPARSLRDGTPTLVPADVVTLTLEAHPGWRPPAFLSSTNGLASGNTRVEAALHGLYEVIERDAVSATLLGGDRGVRVDPRGCGSPIVNDLCDRVERAGVTLELRSVPSPTGLPCYQAWLACDDYPAAMFGFGCHLSTEIAVTRSITEAAQTRLTYIAGARDDLRGDADTADTGRRRDPEGPVTPIPRSVPVEHDSLPADLECVVGLATAAFGHPPLVVDLTRDDIGVPVVKVVAPGARIRTELL